MKKSTKGAAAAAIAGVLLLGGVGSLAFWTDSITIGGDSIESGQLSLDDTTGDDNTCANSPWTLDSGEPGTAFDPDTDTIVPGDVLTKECTFNVVAIGNHLRASLLTAQGLTPDPLAPPVTTIDSSFTIGGNPATSITEANNNQELKATIKLTFPYGVEDNSSQDGFVSIDGYTIVATQVHN